MKVKLSLLMFALGVLLILPCCRERLRAPQTDSSVNAYDSEADWNNPDHLIPLNYQQTEGKRIFYDKCVWCHADATPAGPSNRSNLTPTPHLINDGSTLNPLSDEFLQNLITLGGSALGKSAMMPPWGRTLSQEEIRAVIAYIRAVAQPPYQPSAGPKPQYSVKQSSGKEDSTK